MAIAMGFKNISRRRSSLPLSSPCLKPGASRSFFGDLTDRIERLSHRHNRSLTDQINQAVKTAVHHWEVHPINKIVFGCYRVPQKFAPAPKANRQKLLHPQAAKSSTFPANRGNHGALMTALKIQIFAVFSQKISLEVSPFLSGGGVSKHQ
ncbi:MULTISPECIES: hypothetical protein [unclassified Microcoleus]|uniref:hypothetical protein n=1 Tax=unclassified Microcoleus TaxID=2642155 RepID=UPI002FCF207C